MTMAEAATIASNILAITVRGGSVEEVLEALSPAFQEGGPRFHEVVLAQVQLTAVLVSLTAELQKTDPEQVLAMMLDANAVAALDLEFNDVSDADSLRTEDDE